MIENRIIATNLSEIHIERKTRQRTDLTADSVLDLAVTIGANGWISPIIVSKDDMHIVAGERRYTAVSVLRKAFLGNYAALEFSKPEEAKARLAPVLKCPVDSWEHWSKIPVQFGLKLDHISKHLMELIENLHRQDLSWQDQARACYKLHEAYLREALPKQQKWTISDTAASIGLSSEQTGTYIRAWRDLISGDSKLSSVIKGSTSLKSAAKAADRVKSRRAGPLTLDTPISFKPPSTKLSLDATAPVITEPSSYIHNFDFHKFAHEHEDAPFNFLHCDFPYGINFNSGPGQGTAADTIQDGEYDDSPEIYWQLIETLIKERKSLLAPSCHIMFWFSQNLRRETEDAFKAGWPDAVINPHLMIWHCSDNSGIVPDPQRYGRRTYETAMLITVGDRKIAAPKALSFAFPRNGPRIHRSQKPIEVLSHFFGMFVDESSSVLDPTCGSGTSIIAAKRANAAHIVGLEKDFAMYEAACKFVNEEIKSA